MREQAGEGVLSEKVVRSCANMRRGQSDGLEGECV